MLNREANFNKSVLQMQSVLLCDLNGTIIDVPTNLDEILINYCQQQHLPIIDCTDLHILLHSKTRSTQIWTQLDAASYSNQLNRLHTLLHLDFIGDHYPVRVFPGWQQVFQTLQRQGWKFGVYTNSMRSFCQRVLQVKHLVQYFSVVKCNDDLQVLQLRPKPAPDAMPIILQELQLPSTAAIYYIGDSARDIQFAHNTHVHSIFASWGYGNHSKVLALKPELIVNKPIELLTVLPQ